MALERCSHILEDFACCLGSPEPSRTVQKSGVIVGDHRVPPCGCGKHGIDPLCLLDVWHWEGKHWDTACLPPGAA